LKLEPVAEPLSPIGARLGTSRDWLSLHPQTAPETAVTTRSDRRYPDDPTRADYPTLAAIIARSQIVVPNAIKPKIMPSVTPRRSLPAGFDDTDIAILEWIAAEGRRAARRLIQI
jgi:hypothetical protein